MPANVGRMFYEGAVPWHGLGKRVGKALTWAEAVVEAGLDWTVRKSPVRFMRDEFGTIQDLAMYSAKAVTWREDTGQPLGIVSSDYTVVQNKQVGQILDAVVGEVGAHYHTAGWLGAGEKVWALIKLPGILRVIGDDVVEKYLMACTGHDGSLAFWVVETPIRVVCQNTLMAAIQGAGKGSFRATHTKDMSLDVKAIRERLGYAQEKFSVLEQAYQKMARIPLAAGVGIGKERNYFKQVIEYPWINPQIQPPKQGEWDDEKASQRMKNRLDDLLALYEGGKGMDLPGVKGSVWAGYNAVTEYADYFNGKKNETRARSTLFGSGAKMKERAFNLAMELVA